MAQYQLFQLYLEAVLGRFADRVTTDERGAATAEHIVMIAAAVIGAATVGVIIWNKMRAGANNIQTPAP